MQKKIPEHAGTRPISRFLLERERSHLFPSYLKLKIFLTIYAPNRVKPNVTYDTVTV